MSLYFSYRDGEINGVHYHFVALGDMEAAIQRGEFVEYAKVHTNMYGTSVKAVGDVSSLQPLSYCDLYHIRIHSVTYYNLIR